MLDGQRCDFSGSSVKEDASGTVREKDLVLEMGDYKGFQMPGNRVVFRRGMGAGGGLPGRLPVGRRTRGQIRRFLRRLFCRDQRAVGNLGLNCLYLLSQPLVGRPLLERAVQIPDRRRLETRQAAKRPRAAGVLRNPPRAISSFSNVLCPL